MENKTYKRTTVTSALPYANADTWLVCMCLPISMCAICA